MTTRLVRWMTGKARPLATVFGAVVVFGAMFGVADVAPVSGASAPTVVSFTFDNNWESQMTAAADLAKAGMQGTFYIISGWIGLPGFMSMSDLDTLVADGDEIAGKTIDNVDLLNMSNATQFSSTSNSAEAEREICGGRNVLINDGFDVTDFAYPFADVGYTNLLQTCGFNSARGVGDLYDPDTTVDGCPASSCPYADALPLSTTPPAAGAATSGNYIWDFDAPDDAEISTTVADMEAEVTGAEQNGGGYLAFSFHQICDQGQVVDGVTCDPTYSWSPENFESFVQWIQTQEASGAVQVKTVQQVVGGTEAPEVTPPGASAVTTSTTNELYNPTLAEETNDPATQTVPDCFQQEGYGSNTSSFAWSTTGGYDGGQEDVTLSNVDGAGDANLVTSFDQGQCAPTTNPGDSYELSVYYESSVPVYFNVYGRSPQGTWSYWTGSQTFPAESTWTLATWETPAVPTSIDAMSWGMTIDSDGTLSTSNYGQYDLGSAVPAPATAGTNILPDPTFDGSNQSCWLLDSYGTGTNAVSFSPTGGQTGGEVTLTSSGLTNASGADVSTAFDNGNCSPTVTPGDGYTFSGYYQTTSQNTLPIAYVRSATTGTWSYLDAGATLATTSGSWAPFTLTIPGSSIPVGTNAMSVGLIIESDGTVSTSDVSLVDTTPVTAAPAIVTAPTSETVTALTDATFTAVASGGPLPAVQWQVEAPGTTTWTNIPGATQDVLTVPSATVAESGSQYQAVFTSNGTETATTTPVTLTVNPAAQAISFTAPSTGIAGASVAVNAVGGASGEPVLFTVDPNSGAGVCSTSGTNGNTITFNLVGTCIIDANQAASTNFTAAAQVSQTIAVGLGTQAITFTAPAPGVVGTSATLVATGGASGEPIVFTTDPNSGAGVCSVTGTTVSYLAVGNCVIDANQAGNTSYSAALQVSQTVAVGVGTQTITFTAPAPGVVGTSATLVATGGASGNPVTFTMDSTSGTGVCSVTGTTVSYLAVGDCVIDANQAASTNYAAAPQVSQTVAVGLVAQTITFTAPAPGVVGTSATLVATGGASGNPVTFTMDSTSGSGVCTVSGTTVSYLAVGSCVIDANQAASTTYAAAPQVSQTVAVGVGTQTIIFTALAPGVVGTSANLVASGGASGNPVTFSTDSTSVAGVCNVSGTTVNYTAVGSCVIDANQAASTNYAAAPQVSQTVAVGQGAQAIAFADPPSAPVGTSATLSATGGASGNPVTFTVDSASGTGVCTVSGTTVNYTAVGNCVIDANQAASTSYAAAPQVSQTVAVTQGAQAIIFTAPAPGAVGTSATLSATGGASGNPVTFTVDSASGSGVCTVTGTTVKYTALGSCVIDANQAASTNYAAAPQVSQTVTVGPVGTTTQTITFATIAKQTLSTTPLTVTATASSGLPVTLTATTTSVCSGSGASPASITLLTAGTCTITASQAGNTVYAAATSVTRSFTVAAVTQTITFATIARQTLTASPLTVSATASSGLPVTLTATTPNVCTGSSTSPVSIKLLTAGTCTITASQAGGGVYAAAASVTRSFTVADATQTITFATIARQTLSTPSLTVSATASSGLSVTLTATTTSVCSGSGTSPVSITLLAAGTCTITASQAGNTVYAPANPVTRSFTVAAVTQTITFATIARQTLSTKPLTVSATATSGLAVTLTATTPTVCIGSGTSPVSITLVAAGTCTITASQAGGGVYAAAPSVTRNFTVALATQTITFATIAKQTLSTTSLTESATATSGLAVTLTATTPTVCIGSGTSPVSITLLAAGTCTITASQAGGGVYAAAPSVTRSFTVAGVTQTITFATIARQTLSTTPLTVTATASSTLPVTLTATTTTVCSGSGTSPASITLLAAGTCTITASQAGNTLYAAANSVTRSFTVVA